MDLLEIKLSVMAMNKERLEAIALRVEAIAFDIRIETKQLLFGEIPSRPSVPSRAPVWLASALAKL